MGRRPGPPKRPVTLYLEEQTLSVLKVIAEHFDDVSDIETQSQILPAIRAYIKTMKAKDPELEKKITAIENADVPRIEEVRKQKKLLQPKRIIETTKNG